MKNIILFNDSTLVVPGIISTSAGEIIVDEKYYTTAYGLCIPYTSYSLILLEYLKRDRKINKTYPLTSMLLDNDNCLNDVLYSKKDIIYWSIPIVNKNWNVLSDSHEVTIALNEFAANVKDPKEIIQFLDNNFQSTVRRPIFINRKKWHTQRKKNKQTKILDEYTEKHCM